MWRWLNTVVGVEDGGDGVPITRLDIIMNWTGAVALVALAVGWALLLRVR